MFRCTLSNESPGHVARPVVCESPSKMASMSRSDRAAGVDCLEGDESDDCGMSADREGRESTVVGVGVCLCVLSWLMRFVGWCARQCRFLVVLAGKACGARHAHFIVISSVRLGPAWIYTTTGSPHEPLF